jgi:hypothetical protein
VSDKQTPEHGDLIKGLVFAGVLCYVLGKYFEKSPESPAVFPEAVSCLTGTLRFQTCS